MATIQIHIVHIFREANQLVDCITNIAINQKDRQQYHKFQDLPSMPRKILNIDKQRYQKLE